jgi:hypothetical protein
MRFRRAVLALLLLVLLAPALAMHRPATAAAGECDTTVGEVYFPQTNKCVPKIFYEYWLANGGLAQQGLPVSDDFTEISAADGKTYLVQYFERARFESHPEATDPRYKVLLGLVGSEQYKAKYPSGVRDVPAGPCQQGDQYFEQTKFCVVPRFYDYWLRNGGLAQQGLPISPAFMETNPTDNKQYLTQYFERARFEYHPEIQDPKFQVLLGLLGGEQYNSKYPGITPVLSDSLNDRNFSALETINNGEVHARYDRGGFRITVKVPDYGWGVNYAPSNASPVATINRLGFNDQRIEVEFTHLAGPVDGSVEMTCRQSATDPNKYVRFTIGPSDGYYGILASFGPGENDFKTIAGRGEARSPLAQVGNAPSRMRVDCVGDTFTLYVNGQKVAEGRDSTIAGGEQVGFSASTFEAGGTDVVFRNFTAAIPRR